MQITLNFEDKQQQDTFLDAISELGDRLPYHVTILGNKLSISISKSSIEKQKVFLNNVNQYLRDEALTHILQS